MTDQQNNPNEPGTNQPPGSVNPPSPANLSADGSIPPPLPPLPPPASGSAPASEPAASEPPPPPQASQPQPSAPATPPVSPGPLPPYSKSGRVVDPTATPDQKTYCMLMHLSLILASVFPIVSTIVPLIMWQIKRSESPFVDDHGKESLNFHITLLLYGIPGVMLIFTGVGACIGIPLVGAVYVLGLVGLIIASIAAQNGEYYRYPMCIRFVR